MSAVLGTLGATQVTSILSGPTWPKPKSVGAGTAIETREQNEFCYCSSKKVAR